MTVKDVQRANRSSDHNHLVRPTGVSACLNKALAMHLFTAFCNDYLEHIGHKVT